MPRDANVPPFWDTPSLKVYGLPSVAEARLVAEDRLVDRIDDDGVGPPFRAAALSFDANACSTSRAIF
jgi:hypothetical protein